MITSELLRTLAAAFAEHESVADLRNGDDRRRLLISGMGICARLLWETWMSDLIPVSGRTTIERALDDIERTARQVNREIKSGCRMFSEAGGGSSR